jgi:hypothetical protein
MLNISSRVKIFSGGDDLLNINSGANVIRWYVIKLNVSVRTLEQ